MKTISLLRSVISILPVLLVVEASPIGSPALRCVGSGRGNQGGSFAIKDCKLLTREPGFQEMVSLCGEHAVCESHFPNIYANGDVVENFAQAMNRLRAFKCFFELPEEKQCHHQLKQYVCRMLFPKCYDISKDDLRTLWPANTPESLQVFPCKEMCLAVKGNCTTDKAPYPRWLDCASPNLEAKRLVHYEVTSVVPCEPVSPPPGNGTGCNQATEECIPQNCIHQVMFN